MVVVGLLKGFSVCVFAVCNEQNAVLIMLILKSMSSEQSMNNNDSKDHVSLTNEWASLKPFPFIR